MSDIERQPQPGIGENDREKELSIAEAVKIALFCIFLSQGKPDLEASCIQYIRTKHKNAFIGLDIERLREQLIIAAEKIRENFAFHASIPDGTMATSDNISRTMKFIYYYLAPTEGSSAEISNKLLLEDHERIVENPYGRPRIPNENLPKTFWSDAWHSNICYFAILGRKAPHPWLDEMLSDVRERLPRNSYDPDFQILQEIIDSYNLHHPTDQVVWPPTNEKKKS